MIDKVERIPVGFRRMGIVFENDRADMDKLLARHAQGDLTLGHDRQRQKHPEHGSIVAMPHTGMAHHRHRLKARFDASRGITPMSRQPVSVSLSTARRSAAKLPSAPNHLEEPRRGWPWTLQCAPFQASSADKRSQRPCSRPNSPRHGPVGKSTP